MLPLVCNDAVAILFMFDLSRKSTLNSIKEWYRQARGFNKVRLMARSAQLRLDPVPGLIGPQADDETSRPKLMGLVV